MRGLISPLPTPPAPQTITPSSALYCLAGSCTPFTVPRHRLYVSSTYTWPHFFFLLFLILLPKTGQGVGSQLLFGKLKENVTCSSVHRQSVYGYTHRTICGRDTFYTPGSIAGRLCGASLEHAAESKGLHRPHRFSRGTGLLIHFHSCVFGPTNLPPTTITGKNKFG